MSKHVAVLMGGPSVEREVSLVSGDECARALESRGYRVTRVDAGRDLPRKLDELQPDCVFNALHGRLGEDGRVQGLLDWMQIPYTHSGVLASALAMDKEKTKRAYVAAGLPVAPSGLWPSREIQRRHVMEPPYVVKPYNEGSSVGVYIVGESPNGPPLLAEDSPQVMMVEAYVPGRELTTTVIGDKALGVTEIVTDGWYDYHAKYAAGGSRHVVPAQVPAEIELYCLDYALRAHEVLGCKGVSRTDFRWDEGRGLEGLVLLETNTQPGMTPTSLAPEQALVQGMTFGQLCAWMVEDASCNR